MKIHHLNQFKIKKGKRKLPFVTSSGESANFLMEDLGLVLQFISTNNSAIA